jgi:hypothetical protein
MELLDRYLQAVKRHLPWPRQDDIIAELKANLEAQLEDKESALGRPLTTGETEDWLRQIGPPMRVAARYQPQQYLIGPAIFPTYWFVLRMAALWSMVIYSIVSAVLMATQNPSGDAVVEAVLRVPGILMQVAAWVTLAFAAFEFAATRYPSKCPALAKLTDDWKPSELPPLETESAAGKKPRSFSHAVAEVIFGFIFLVWLLLIPHYPFLLMGPGAFYLKASPFQFAPVWFPFYWCLVALNVVQLGWNSVDLVRGSWQRPQLLKQLAIKIFGLIPLALLLAVHDQTYFMLRNPARDEMQYGAALTTINLAIHKGLMLVCAIVVLQLLWEIGRISLEAYRKHAAATR